VDKVIYRREDSSVQAKFSHEELAKIRSGLVQWDQFQLWADLDKEACPCIQEWMGKHGM
jgi:hypothetical protein